LEKVNLAVLGLFHGHRFVERIRNSDFACLAAVADLDPGKLDGIGNDVEVFRDYKELIKKMQGKIDGIIAALPNDLHVEVTEEAAKAGLPLLLEKPIACNLEDADKIVKIVKDSGIKFLVGHHRRFSKRIDQVKKTIESGRLGKIIGINALFTAKKIDDYFKQDWRITEGKGGVLLINAIHDVDLLRYLVGEIDVVQGRATNTRGHQVEDTGAIVLGFKNGTIATIFVTDNSPSPWYFEGCGEEYDYSYSIGYHSYHFFGDKASLTYPRMDLFYYKEDPDAGWPRPINQERIMVERFDVIEEELRHFCGIIRGKAESRITAEDAAGSLRVIKAVKESSRSGKAVYLNKM
jgi:predicted dehydrogenase